MNIIPPLPPSIEIDADLTDAGAFRPRPAETSHVYRLKLTSRHPVTDDWA